MKFIKNISGPRTITPLKIVVHLILILPTLKPAIGNTEWIETTEIIEKTPSESDRYSFVVLQGSSDIYLQNTSYAIISEKIVKAWNQLEINKPGQYYLFVREYDCENHLQKPISNYFFDGRSIQKQTNIDKSWVPLKKGPDSQLFNRACQNSLSARQRHQPKQSSASDAKHNATSLSPWKESINGRYCLTGVCLGEPIDLLPQQHLWADREATSAENAVSAYSSFRKAAQTTLICPFNVPSDSSKPYLKLAATIDNNNFEVSATPRSKENTSNNSNYAVRSINYRSNITPENYLALEKLLQKEYKELKPVYIGTFREKFFSGVQGKNVSISISPPIPTNGKIENFNNLVRISLIWLYSTDLDPYSMGVKKSLQSQNGCDQRY